MFLNDLQKKKLWTFLTFCDIFYLFLSLIYFETHRNLCFQQLSKGTLVQEDFSPSDNCPRRLLSKEKVLQNKECDFICSLIWASFALVNASLDKSAIGQLPTLQLSSWTIVLWTIAATPKEIIWPKNKLSRLRCPPWSFQQYWTWILQMKVSCPRQHR